MRYTSRIAVVGVAAALMIGLLSAEAAFAVSYTYPGKGVGTSRLGQTYSSAASKISGTYKTVRDRSYSYTVYHTYVGTKMSNGRYPIELYSKSTKRVFRFQINSSRYPTSKGVKIGSAEDSVKVAYPSAKGPYTSGYYNRYTIKHSIYSYATYTDFYCKGNVVRYLIVRR